jgi:Cys-rich protein (TIGR01571 family)
MTWSSKSIDIDILIYGCLCTPCLFGENAYKVKRHPSCVSYALSYSVLALSSNMIGVCIGNMIFMQNPCMIATCATLSTSIAIAEYAGSMRTDIRDLYDIDGTPNCDNVTHFFCTSCAICQEAHEIRERSNRIPCHPLTQTMEKCIVEKGINGMI